MAMRPTHASRRAAVLSEGNGPTTSSPENSLPPHCENLSLIESPLQYRFATPKPLKTRWGPEGCVIAPLCKLSTGRF